ncbi:hypothetical protein M8C21_001072, partial [Ambrosia artemisiifolia]
NLNGLVDNVILQVLIRYVAKFMKKSDQALPSLDS